MGSLPAILGGNRRPWAFSAAVDRLFPPNTPVFAPFMEPSDRLLARFGRNWGLDRRDIQAALSELT
jgi:hypothetical protein